MFTAIFPTLRGFVEFATCQKGPSYELILKAIGWLWRWKWKKSGISRMPGQFRKIQAFPECPSNLGKSRHFRKCFKSGNPCDIYTIPHKMRARNSRVSRKYCRKDWSDFPSFPRQARRIRKWWWWLGPRTSWRRRSRSPWRRSGSLKNQNNII